MGLSAHCICLSEYLVNGIPLDPVLSCFTPVHEAERCKNGPKIVMMWVIYKVAISGLHPICQD